MLKYMLAIVAQSSGPSTATFIVSLLVAGVVSPGLAILASRWSDRRRFAHERKLKASDDLIERIDDVAVSLDELGGACATMRQAFLAWGVSAPDKVQPLMLAAEDAYQRARALNARLGIRPYANQEVLAKAEAAAKSLHESAKAVRGALIRRQAASAATGQESLAELPVGPVMEHIETGYKQIAEYHEKARVAVGKLLA
jgi:hypothetical protein